MTDDEFRISILDEYTTVKNVEVEYEIYDDRFVFWVPNNLEKARSAYAYDPVFNAAVDVYSERKRQRPETTLINSLSKLLHIEKRLLGVAEHTETACLEREYYRAQCPNPNHDEPSIGELKSMFIEGQIGIHEFEERVEERLNGEGVDNDD